MANLPMFRFYCHKVLPLVYDDSLSYNEVLCKVVSTLNQVIANDNSMSAEIQQLQQELKVVQEWIDNFKFDQIEEIIAEYIPVSVMFGLSQDGHFVAYIPESWKSIIFRTTGYDVKCPCQPEYGHLVLLY